MTLFFIALPSHGSYRCSSWEDQEWMSREPVTRMLSGYAKQECPLT